MNNETQRQKEIKLALQIKSVNSFKEAVELIGQFAYEMKAQGFVEGQNDAIQEIRENYQPKR
jgi:hypothetical protein